PDSAMYDQQTNETWDYYFPTDYLPYSIDYVEPVEGTEAGTMLLSNLGGDLALTPLLPGYRAFWKSPIRGGSRRG
ncbi:MAG: hypothetical protein ACP5KN_06620, partial [Armatimonadota bacterium]